MKPPPFLVKLKTLTATVDPDVACWTPDGKSFSIKSLDKFTKEIKKYYKGSLTTFVRQLHFYSFKKIDVKGKTWSFSHPLFQRDKPLLVFDIKRKTKNIENDGYALDSTVKEVREYISNLESTISKQQSEIEELKAKVESLMKNKDSNVDELETKIESIVEKYMSSSFSKSTQLKRKCVDIDEKSEDCVHQMPKKSKNNTYDPVAKVEDTANETLNGSEPLPCPDLYKEIMNLPFTDVYYPEGIEQQYVGR